MGFRKNVQREWALLSEWLTFYHRSAEIWINLRVGPEKPAPIGVFDLALWSKMARVANRWADCVFLEPGSLNLVEAKLEPDPGVFSQLLHYGRKLRQTPEFEQYAGLPLTLWALVSRDDPSVSDEAKYYGVRWVVFRPSQQADEDQHPRGFAIADNGIQAPAALGEMIDGIKLPQK